MPPPPPGPVAPSQPCAPPGFYPVNHTDCLVSALHHCFDGPTGELAHAFFPPHGGIHFDDSEYWVLGPTRYSWKKGDGLASCGALCTSVGRAGGLWGWWLRFGVEEAGRRGWEEAIGLGSRSPEPPPTPAPCCWRGSWSYIPGGRAHCLCWPGTFLSSHGCAEGGSVATLQMWPWQVRLVGKAGRAGPGFEGLTHGTCRRLAH